MATQGAPAEGHSPYPTYEELLAAQQWVRPAANSGQLLFWTLDGPLTRAISVMPSPFAPDGSLTPYYDQSTAEWHSVARLPITEPKVSSITVHVYQLDEWEGAWCEEHMEHTDPDDEEDTNDDVEWTSTELDDGSTEPHLLKCCGTTRPGGEGFSVTVRPTGEEDFVTVHHFLEVVHPWLMSLKRDILTAKQLLEGREQRQSDDTQLMVNLNAFESLMIEEKDEWISFKRRDPRRTINVSAA